jgi:two-component system, sensor histidine kinase and response regulator
VTLEYDHENYLLLTTVKDTGIGIPSEKQQLLFQAFKANQNDDDTISYVDSTSGIGVGLSNSKILVESMGGTINLQSEVGIGTTVRFSVDANASSGL